MSHLVSLSDHRRRRRRVYFHRTELAQILRVYSERVSRGEWRDYAIDHAVGVALFSVFRHSYDRPMFAIAKFPGLGGKPDDFVLLSGRQRLGRSHSLSDLLRLFDQTPRLVPQA
jgi:hypothetical protein